MDIFGKIGQVLEDNDESSFVVAKNLIKACTKAELIPVLVNEIDRQRRMKCLNIERSYFVTLSEACKLGVPGTIESIRLKSAGELRELLESRFALGNGERVTWGEATIPQHLMRISMLEKKVAGINQTIGHHQEAIEMIKAAGSDCLNAAKGCSMAA